MPLTPTEKIICTMGEKHSMTLLDSVLSVLSLSLYYWCLARRRTRQSEVVVLTTKRIVHINLFQRKGRFPASLGNVEVEVNSYFPGNNITAGYVRLFNERMVSSIECDAGALTVSLPKDTMSKTFCKSMQHATSRVIPIASSAKEVYDLLPPKMLDFVSPSHRVSDSTTEPIVAPAEVAPLLLESEAVVHTFEGGQSFAPCCSVSSGRVCEPTGNVSDHDNSRGMLFSWCGRQLASMICCACIIVAGENATWLDIDSFSYICNYHPDHGLYTKVLVWLTQCMTLCVRPLARSNDLIVTTNSVFFTSNVVYTENCLKRKSRHLGSYFVCWVPIRQLAAHKSSVNLYGAHSDGQCCCGLCCTLPDCLGHSRYNLEVFTRNGFSFSYTQDVPFKNWLEDVGYMSVLAVLGVVTWKATPSTAPIGAMDRV
jgi:hypothetical protein